LAERALFLMLDEIPEDRRRGERDLVADFEAEQPRILRALLDAVAYGLGKSATTKPPCLPRMADFAQWVTACEGAFWAPGTIMAAYADNHDAVVETALTADAVASTVRSLMATTCQWEGTTRDLLTGLAAARTDVRRGDKKWPADGRALLARLQRVRPFLRHIGISIEFTRAGGSSTVTITQAAGQQRNSMSDREVASGVQACQRKVGCSRRQIAVDGRLRQTLMAPVELDGASAGGSAIKVQFPGGARVWISASSPPELATAVVKALSQR
jgi:hypothetical protein